MVESIELSNQDTPTNSKIDLSASQSTPTEESKASGDSQSEDSDDPKVDEGNALPKLTE